MMVWGPASEHSPPLACARAMRSSQKVLAGSITLSRCAREIEGSDCAAAISP